MSSTDIVKGGTVVVLGGKAGLFHLFENAELTL